MSFFKILLVLLVALIVFGPERLPTIAQAIGRFFGQMLSIFNQVQKEFSQEIRENSPEKKQLPQSSVEPQ